MNYEPVVGSASKAILEAQSEFDDSSDAYLVCGQFWLRDPVGRYAQPNSDRWIQAGFLVCTTGLYFCFYWLDFLLRGEEYLEQVRFLSLLNDIQISSEQSSIQTNLFGSLERSYLIETWHSLNTSNYPILE